MSLVNMIEVSLICHTSCTGSYSLMKSITERGIIHAQRQPFITPLAMIKGVYRIPFRSLEGIARLFSRNY
jgi:predicted thioredoxin/glutaredoxin